MQPLALYIHWPFCLAKCPYCDFNSHVRDRLPERRFAAALRTELEHEAARLQEGGPRLLQSIFFGGGTPSLMQPDSVAGLVARAKSLFEPSADLEITLEANPTSVEASRLRDFRDAGVNRLSLGVQALDDQALRLLGREHTAKQAVAALETGRALFERLSFDLIYARPQQGLAAWRGELDQALRLVSDHLSLYQLTIEPGTRYQAMHRQGLITLPDDDHAAALYQETARVAGLHGLEAYEVSNYARPGAQSRHNLAYWRYGDYAGIGPGAHGRLTLRGRLFATRRHRAPEPWAERVERTGSGETSLEELSLLDRTREMLLMGLRLSEGISAPAFQARTGTALRAALDPDILQAAEAEGYLAWDADRLRPTPAGRLRLDALLGALVL